VQPLIEVEGLRYAYPDGTEALRGVKFRMQAGESVALLGSNGSGKTTFLLHMAGLLDGEGSIHIAGERMTAATKPALQQKTGYVFQDSDDQLFMQTVLEDIAFGPLHRGMSPEAALARANELLAQLNIAHLANRAPYHLSAGEKKRAALAGVLAMQPEILIFDEPTTFLDPPGQRELALLLRGLPQAKLIATHDIWFARQVASRAAFFRDGQICGEGSVDDIVQRFDWNLK